jgi:HAD superfamily hydrolase (TIGR01549 family)
MAFMPKLRGIVFDLDGTLVDSLGATFDAFNHSIEHFGGKRLTGEQILSYFGPGEGGIFARILGQENALPAYTRARDYFDRNIHHVSLHAGVGELLERLKSASVPISIFTGRGWETTEIILKAHRLLDRFITVVANDHVVDHKPSPEGLKLALARMGLEPAHALMVGDSRADIIAAKSAGSPGVAAAWDLMVDRPKLEAQRPEYWADTPGAIWDILHKN